MKLCRIETADGIKPAIVDADGAARDLSQHLPDIELSSVAPAALDKLRSLDIATLPLISGRFAPVINDIRRILCIGLNYSDHAAEAGMAVPDHPLLFSKLQGFRKNRLGSRACGHYRHQGAACIRSGCVVLCGGLRDLQ